MEKIMLLNTLEDLRPAVIGLGYVGLPLAVEIGKSRQILGFDINAERVAQLQQGRDDTLEVSADALAEASYLRFSHDPAALEACNTYIIAVPTPVDANNRPDLRVLLKASETVGGVLEKGDLVIYESTVFPGATEEICVPLLEKVSGLRFNTDFFAGYSPERVNPGDKEHRLPSICKVTSGSTPQVAELVNAFYASIITAGTYKAQSIRVAEAAKVIENTQRDLNIALINELAVIFNKMGIDTEAVLQAAGTKWNFLPFRPGLVGGHCIGVDPYYLTHKAQEIGHHPEIILAGRRINDSMGDYVASRMVKAMLKKQIPVEGVRLLVMGLTFKENCPDTRNTKVTDVIKALREYGITAEVTDPHANAQEVYEHFGIMLVEKPELNAYDGIILAVAHKEFKEMDAGAVRAFGKANHVFFDMKSIFAQSESDLRL